MANKLINTTSLTNVGDAIRTKLGVSTTYKVSEMANAISSIPSAQTLYLHQIIIAGEDSLLSSTNYVCLSIVTTSSTEFTFDTLKTFLYNKGYTSTSNLYFTGKDRTAVGYNNLGVCVESATASNILYFDRERSQTYYECLISDTVTQWS